MTGIGITHIGLCTPLGNSAESVLSKLLQGDTSAMQWRDDLLFEKSIIKEEEIRKQNILNEKIKYIANKQIEFANEEFKRKEMEAKAMA